MCSRFARVQPTLVESDCNDIIVMSAIVAPVRSSGYKRKRFRNSRRSTGPLAPEDLELAMMETEKEAKLEMTRIDQVGLLISDVSGNEEKFHRAIDTETSLP